MNKVKERRRKEVEEAEARRIARMEAMSKVREVLKSVQFCNLFAIAQQKILDHYKPGRIVNSANGTAPPSRRRRRCRAARR